MPKILLTVTNDLSYDQRMQRICTSLTHAGYDVQLIGRKLLTSSDLQSFPFQQKRLYCYFKKGKLFYAEYNIRLFFYLLFTRTDAICSIDLDTILAGFWVAKFRRKYFIYDAHEYFTEVPEVIERPRVQRMWARIAQYTIPRTQYAYTVCESLARIFQEKYNTHFDVIRNVPIRQKNRPEISKKTPKVILYQGALNEGRGIEAAIQAMQFIDDAVLWLAGEGDLSKDLRDLCKALGLTQKVKFLGYVQPADLQVLTPQASIGLNLLENKGLNYYYSLSNKFLDYIQAHIPSVNMNFPEVKKINEQHEVAVLIDDLEVPTVVNAIQQLLNDESLYHRLQKNCITAADIYIWEEEEKRLIEFYRRFLPQKL